MMLLQGAVLFCAHSLYMIPYIYNIEKELVESDLQRSIEALYKEQLDLETLVQDSRTFQSSHDIIKANQRIINKPLVPNHASRFDVFLENNLNIIYILNKKQEILWGAIYDLSTGQEILMPQMISEVDVINPSFLVQDDLFSIKSGFHVTTRGPFVLVSAPIFEPNDKSTSVGTLLVGRFIGDESMLRLIGQTRADLRIWPMDSNIIPNKQSRILTSLEETGDDFYSEVIDDQFSLYTPIYDIAEQPLLLISATRLTKFTKIYLTYFHFILGTLITSTTLLLGFIIWVYQRSLAKPLGEFSAFLELNKSDLIHCDSLETTNSLEINALIKGFNEAINHARSHLLKERNQAYSKGMHDMGEQILKDVKSVIAPMSESMAVIERRLRELPLVESERIAAEFECGNMTPERRAQLVKELKTAINILKEFQRSLQSKTQDTHSRISKVMTMIRKHTIKFDVK